MSPQLLAKLIDTSAAALLLYARQWCATPEDVVQEAFLKLVAVRTPPEEPLSWLYRVDPHRIVVMPFLPSLPVRRHKAGEGVITADGVRAKYDLPDQFAFFPAFLTHHKNALYMLEALVDLERRHGVVLHAVFCGSGTPAALALVKRQVDALGLRGRI